jgi:hypothetical protein
VESVDPGTSPAGESNLLARQDVLCFEHFAIKAAERQLLIDGQPATLGSRAFDLLVALIEHATGSGSPQDFECVVNVRIAKMLGPPNSSVGTAASGPRDRMTVYGLKLDFILPQVASGRGP